MFFLLNEVVMCPDEEFQQEKSDEVQRLIRVAINEDIRSGDITSEACISSDKIISGKLILKQSAIVAGLSFIQDVFNEVSSLVKVQLLVDEGSEHPAGAVLGIVTGPARVIFAAERVVLNIIQHLSGIASTTARYVERVEGYNCDILDTRKTLPGLRHLERYAVRVGGGKNHRSALDERFIIKNNHLVFLAKESDTPILEAVKRVRAYRPKVKVEVEVENLRQVEEAIESQAEIIMLDNLTIPMVRRAVKMIDSLAYVEASGGITLDTVVAYAEAGVNGVAIGALTHSVKAIDISLRFRGLIH
jgi:nicotinate-nucleotide pyrophosphorylase (carboxylating)